MRGIIVGTLFVLAACGDDGGSGPPGIIGASLTTDEDAPISHTVEARDPEGRALALEAQPPMHGTVEVDRLRVTYTPSPDYHGPDGFTVTVTNGSLQASARIEITVRPVNDAPEAAGDSFAATEDTPLVRSHAALLANDVDVDGDALTVTAVGSATNGTVSTAGTDITFTPAAEFNGMGSYQYTVSDGVATSTTTVTISVGGVNDAPVAADDTATTPEDTPLAVAAAALVANDVDPEGQTLTVTAVGNATNGAVVLAGGVATFTPDANFSGTGTFEYTASDGASSDTAVVTVTVDAVNDPPVAADDTAATAEDTAVQLTASALLANDADPDGPSLAVTAVGNATNGTVVLAGGVATFTPAADFSGTGAFEYTISDGTAADTGTVAITVNAVNDPPVAADDTATTDEDAAVVIAAATLLANDTDADGPALAITAVSGAINGTAVLVGTDITFTPAADFSGTASFSYTVGDGTAIDTGVVTVTVNAVNDPPVAADDAGVVQVDSPLVLTHAALLANDTDVDGPMLAVTAVQNAVDGTAVLGATTVTFTPALGFTGTATFEYVVSDGTASDVGTVTVTVQAGAVCGDGTIATPEACDDGNTATGDGCDATCQTEPGWTCDGAPSVCTTTCGDAIQAGTEACDDGNADDTDGCTSQCVVGATCTAAALPGADRFAVDPATGHCYASFDDEMTTFPDAHGACAASGGYLVTIASAGEQLLAQAAQHPAQNPWIGAVDTGDTNDAIFAWVTGEPFGFTSFAPGQPDNDNPFGGNGDCLHLLDATGGWNDTNCNISSFVVGRICEVQPDPCGDGVLQSTSGEECEDGNTTPGDGCSATCQLENGCGNGTIEAGEECDDDNATAGDGCSATCQLENGCGNGTVEAGEECDDDNAAGGDGCSATCQLEELAVFSFTGALGNEPMFPADGAAPAPGLAAIPVMSRGPGLDPAAAANEYSSEQWQLTAAIDPADYYGFTVTPAAGFAMSLLGIELDERRSASGPLFWSLRSSLDGFASDLAMFTLPDDTAFRRDQRITLGPAFANLTAPVELRIYGWDAEGSLGTWRLDNVELLGFTTGP